jgi:hypothetical protein
VRIKIMDTDWTVEKRKAHDPELMVEDVSCRGTCWCGHYKIFLSEELTAATAGTVVRHELTHAFLYLTQLEFPKKFTEENVCDFVGGFAPQIVSIAKAVVKELFPSD